MAPGDKVFRKGIAGKTVKQVVIGGDDVELEVEIRFTDNTSFNIRLVPPQIEIVGVDLIGWKGGNSDVIRRFS